MKAQAELYRELPSVDQVLHDPAIPALIAENGQAAVADACRMVLSRLRGEIAAGALDQANLAIALCGIQTAVEAELRRALGYSLRPLINATGVILHTNLGRAPLSSSALEHTQKAAGGYSNLEFDLDTGERGKRDVHVDRLFRRLLADEAAVREPAGRAGTAAAPQSIGIDTDLWGTEPALSDRPEGGTRMGVPARVAMALST